MVLFLLDHAKSVFAGNPKGPAGVRRNPYPCTDWAFQSNRGANQCLHRLLSTDWTSDEVQFPHNGIYTVKVSINREWKHPRGLV